MIMVGASIMIGIITRPPNVTQYPIITISSLFIVASSLPSPSSSPKH